MIEVLLTTDTLEAAVPPSETVAPAANPVPVIVIEVPPTVGPEAGDTVLTVGGLGVGVGVGEGEDDPPQGSTGPTSTHPLDHCHHWELPPNT